MKLLSRSIVQNHVVNMEPACDRVRAVWGDATPVDSGHHNFQRPLFALGVVMLGGALTQHFFERVPIPYT